jgi:hypothetical protein
LESWLIGWTMTTTPATVDPQGHQFSPTTRKNKKKGHTNKKKSGSPGKNTKSKAVDMVRLPRSTDNWNCRWQ